MFDINRIIIILLLMALLYSLYRYQQQTNNISNDANKSLISKKKKTNGKKKKHNKNKDTLSIDNISQASLGSLLDTEKSNNKYVSQDLGSLDSCNSGDSGSITSLLENNEYKDDNFFFQQKK